MSNKKIKILELLIFGANHSECLSMPALETGYLTKPMKGLIENMKKTAAIYS